MKKYLLIIPILIMISCDQSTNIFTKDNTASIKERKLEVFCDSFISSHKDWKQNDIIGESANKDLKDRLSNEISNGLLSDFPLKLYRINEYGPGKYAAHFTTEYTIKTKYEFNFDVIALIQKVQEEKLKTDSLYGLTGHFQKYLSNDFRNYTNGMVYSPNIQIRKNDIYDSAAFDLGIILMNSLEIKRLNY